MIKFKYNYQQNTLSYQIESTWHPIDEEQQFTGRFNSPGFKLNEGWITFTVYKQRIQVFYKPNQTTYYRKYLPKQAPVIFTFSPPDQVQKLRNQWVKGGSYA